MHRKLTLVLSLPGMLTSQSRGCFLAQSSNAAILRLHDAPCIQAYRAFASEMDHSLQAWTLPLTDICPNFEPQECQPHKCVAKVARLIYKP